MKNKKKKKDLNTFSSSSITSTLSESEQNQSSEIDLQIQALNTLKKVEINESEIHKVHQNNKNIISSLILEGATSSEQKIVKEKKDLDPDRKKKVKIIYIKRGMKLVTDQGQYCAIDAVKKYNSSLMPGNIQSPTTAARKINEYSLRKFVGSDKFQGLSTQAQRDAVLNFKKTCFISSDNYMEIQKKQAEET